MVAAYPDVILGGQTFFFRDFGLFGYPLAHYHREHFWRGELPLWNPLNHCGLPFLAQWNTLCLYPGSLLYLLLPLEWSLSLFCLTHLFLAGLGMYFLAWQWTRHRFAAAVAGVAFALNGLALNCLMWPNNIAALGWMPLVVLWVERAAQAGGKALLWAALIGALQMLTGAPEIIALTWVVVGVVVLARTVPNWAAVQTGVARLLGVAVWVTALCAAQLFPFLELLSLSQRHGEFGGSTWAMPWSGWAHLLVPRFGTHEVVPGVVFQTGQYWTTSFYPGVGVVALALVALAQVRERRTWVLGALALGGLVLALGERGGLYAVLGQLLPLGLMRFPIKFVVLTCFALPLLAALAVRAMDTTEEPSWPRRQRVILWITGLLVLGIALLSALAPAEPHAEDGGVGAVSLNGLVRAVFLVVVVGGLVATRALWGRPSGMLAQAMLVVLLGMDVLTHLPRQNPTAPRELLRPGLAALQQLTPRPEHGRSRASLRYPAARTLYSLFTTNLAQDYLIYRLSLHGNCNLLEDLPKVGGFYSLELPHTSEVIQKAFYATTNGGLPGLEDFLGVSQVSHPVQLGQWTNRTGFLPLATIGQQPIFADDATTLEALAHPDFQPAQIVYLPPEAQATVPRGSPTHARIQSAQFRAGECRLEIETSDPTLLVLAQAYHPRWRAFVDGTPERVWRANHGFQAVAVPAGQHVVRLVYQDRLFQLGLGVTVLALLICGVWALRRTTPPPQTTAPANAG